MTEYINESDIDFVGDMLMKYGNDDSILDVSELDGFLTAIVSGPNMILPSQWLPEVWGGADHSPAWESEQEVNRFMGTVMAMMNSSASCLVDAPEEFTAMFNINQAAEPEVIVAEEWCFGYMRGVRLGDWPELPDEINTWLEAIALHGLEENFPVLEQLTLEEHQQTVTEIEPAARKLHKYWLDKRAHLAPGRRTSASHRPSANVLPFVRAQPKIGPNAPCPCGSGKKYKKCCGAH